jgi:hypothetical protein
MFDDRKELHFYFFLFLKLVAKHFQTQTATNSQHQIITIPKFKETVSRNSILSFFK